MLVTEILFSENVEIKGKKTNETVLTLVEMKRVANGNCKRGTKGNVHREKNGL